MCIRVIHGIGVAALDASGLAEFEGCIAMRLGCWLFSAWDDTAPELSNNSKSVMMTSFECWD
jgi:hypothetical protein